MIMIIDEELPEDEKKSPNNEESEQSPEEEGIESANDTFSKFLKGSED